MNVHLYGNLRYTPTFVVKVDRKDELACYGYSDKGCMLVQKPQDFRPEGVSIYARWQNRHAESFSIVPSEKNDGYDLRISLSDNCDGGGCTFSTYHNAGLCILQP